jgi:hypothetical protein
MWVGVEEKRRLDKLPTLRAGDHLKSLSISPKSSERA